MGQERHNVPRLPGERYDELTRESDYFSDRYVGTEPGGMETHDAAAPVGAWIDVVSELLNRVRFDWSSIWEVSLHGDTPARTPGPANRDQRDRPGFLTCEMLSLAIIEYPGVTLREFQDMVNSQSKGTWLIESRHWKGGKHKVRREAQRKVTAEMKAERRAGAGATPSQKLTYPGHPKPPRRR